MANRLDVYKCDTCGNIVEVMHGGPGALTCCAVEMKLLAENTVDAATEKHVPVIEMGEGCITVKVEHIRLLQMIKLIRFQMVWAGGNL